LPPQAVKDGTPHSIAVCVPAPGAMLGLGTEEWGSGPGCHPGKTFEILHANSCFLFALSARKWTPAKV